MGWPSLTLFPALGYVVSSNRPASIQTRYCGAARRHWCCLMFDFVKLKANMIPKTVVHTPHSFQLWRKGKRALLYNQLYIGKRRGRQSKRFILSNVTPECKW